MVPSYKRRPMRSPIDKLRSYAMTDIIDNIAKTATETIFLIDAIIVVGVRKVCAGSVLKVSMFSFVFDLIAIDFKNL